MLTPRVAALWVPWGGYVPKDTRYTGYRVALSSRYVPSLPCKSCDPATRRPVAHKDTFHHASKARAQAALNAMEAKACCDMCSTPLGLWSPGRGMQDIRDAYWIWDLKVLCEPCAVAMEGRLARV